jgi:hypothetical protein
MPTAHASTSTASTTLVIGALRYVPGELMA